MKKAIDIFGEWAEQGKDVGMENTHAMPVNEMIDFALEERANIGKNFSFLDLGCGNGWVVRDVAQNKLCDRSVGIDGAKQMIVNAESRGGENETNIFLQISILLIQTINTMSFIPWKFFII